MEKVKNTKNVTTISDVLFPRLTCCDTKTHTKIDTACLFT